MMTIGITVLPMCQEFYELEKVISNDFAMIIERKTFVEYIVSTFINHDLYNEASTAHVIVNGVYLMMDKQAINKTSHRNITKLINAIGHILAKNFIGSDVHFSGCVQYELHFQITPPIYAA